jgi:putative ABC transport system permease protein
MAIPLSYSTRSLWSRRATTLATMLGIALVVFVLCASQMLSAGMRATLLRAASAERALVMQHDAYSEGGSRIRQATLTHASAAPGVRRSADGQPLVSGESMVQIYLPRLDDVTRISAVQVRGVSENVFALRPEVRVVEGRPPERGRDEAMIGAAIAGNYQRLELGGQLTLRKGRDIRIVGVFEAQGSAYESEVWTDLDVVRTSMGWEGYLSSVTAALESRSAFDGFATVLEADKSLGLAAVPERAYYEKVSEGLARSVTTLGDLVTLIFACGAMLGAAITMNEAIARRRKEIGVLRALGFSAPEVMAAFVVESAAVSMAGALLGVGVASLLAFAQFSVVNYGTGNEIAFPFEPDPTILLRSFLSGAAVGVLGGFFPALKAARTNPVSAMRV